MGDHQYRNSFIIQFLKKFHNLCSGLRIQRTGRLVGQQQTGLGDKGAGHGGPLLLPAGDLVGVLLQQLRNAQLLRDGPELAAHALVVLPRQHQGQEDVVLEGEGVQQVEVLEHEAELVAAEGGQLPLRDAGDVPAVEQHLARSRAVERGEDVQQRGLAGAGLAHDGDVFALQDGKYEDAKKLAEELENTRFHELKIPYVTNVSAEEVTGIRETPGLLTTQISSPVRWMQSMERMIADGVDTFVEIGPGRTLEGFLRKINRNVKVFHISQWEDVDKVCEELADGGNRMEES